MWRVVCRIIKAEDDNKLQLKLQMEEMSKLTLKLNTAENARQNLSDKVLKLEEQLREQVCVDVTISHSIGVILLTLGVKVSVRVTVHKRLKCIHSLMPSLSML
jgi:hypothetical protein